MISSTSNYKIYVVVPGDTMWSIAKRHNVTLDQLIAANPEIANPNLIFPGQKIRIPLFDDDHNVEQDFEKRVIQLVNIEREKNGLKPLIENWELMRVARYKSQDMIDHHYFGHYSPTYGSPFDMLRKFGIEFRTAGENIAKGQKIPEDVMRSWMGSTSHRDNILSKDFTQIGVGFADSNSIPHWTQLFIG